MAAIAPGTAQADDNIEITTLDDVDPGAPVTLRDAIDTANSDPDHDRIFFNASLSGDIDLDSVLPTIGSPLTIDGPGASAIVIDADYDFGILYVDQALATDPVEVNGLTLEHGRNPDSGGGMEITDGDVTVEDAVLHRNDASLAGGGGGGIKISQGKLTLRRTTVELGFATYGGGVYIGDAEALIDDSTISGNYQTGKGGGIYASSAGGAIRIVDTTVSGNQALDGGGLMIQDRTGPVEIERSTISGNTGLTGAGGLYVKPSAGGPLNVVNSTISGNTTTTAGGIRIEGAPATLTSTTISNNTADYRGGGIYGGASLRNVIVADNAAPQGPDLFGGVSAAFSLIESTGSATITATTPGSNITGQDPGLGPLADNGGSTRTRAISRKGAAADAGRSFGLTTDQRGQRRPIELAARSSRAAGADGSDIGAFEIQSSLRCAGRPATIEVTPGRRTAGTNGPDVIVGSARKDRINGRGGKDVICGLGRNDILRGGGGKDKLLGGPGPDRLIGGAGKDVLRGGPGRDTQRQ